MYRADTSSKADELKLINVKTTFNDNSNFNYEVVSTVTRRRNSSDNQSVKTAVTAVQTCNSNGDSQGINPYNPQETDNNGCQVITPFKEETDKDGGSDDV